MFAPNSNHLTEPVDIFFLDVLWIYSSQDALINQKRSSDVLSNLEKVLLRRFGGQKTKSAISVVHDLKPNQPFGLVRFRFIKGYFFSSGSLLASKPNQQFAGSL